MRSLMRANQLRSVWRRKFIHTIDSKQAMPVPANVLALAVCKGLAQSGLGERSHLYPDQKRLAAMARVGLSSVCSGINPP